MHIVFAQTAPCLQVYIDAVTLWEFHPTLFSFGYNLLTRRTYFALVVLPTFAVLRAFAHFCPPMPDIGMQVFKGVSIDTILLFASAI